MKKGSIIVLKQNEGNNAAGQPVARFLRHMLPDIRSYLKNVFWPNFFVGAAFQILNIQQYASGLKLGPAAILNQNPIFEIGSRKPLSVRLV